MQISLKKLVLSERKYYSNIRSSTYKSFEYEKQIRASFYALKHLYPKAKFPPVYFVIGRATSGATASNNGLIIGIETLSNENFKTNYGRPSISLDLLPYIVSHEIIHFLQADNNNSSLLSRCIREGSADFIAELIAGEKIKLLNGEYVYPYGDAHEKELWREFRLVMHKEELSPWLYSQTNDERPQNLGCWIGYKIVESHYENMSDEVWLLMIF